MMTLCLMGQYFSYRTYCFLAKGNEWTQSGSLASVIFRVKGVGNIPLISNVTDSENKAAALEWLAIFLYFYFHENNMHNKI